jgi:hypothetical protein
VCVSFDVVARKCSCVSQQLLSRVFGYLLHLKNHNFTMYMRQMVLFTVVMQHSGLTLFGMPSCAQLKADARFAQTWVDQWMSR